MKKINLLLFVLFALVLFSCKNTESEFKSPTDKSISQLESFMLLNADSTIILDAIIIENTVYVIKRDNADDITSVLKRNDYSGMVDTLVVLLIIFLIIIIIEFIIYTWS